MRCSRCELQISQSSGHPCGPGSPPVPVHHPPPAGRPHRHDGHLHRLLSVCSSASGQMMLLILPESKTVKCSIDFLNNLKLHWFETCYYPGGDSALHGQPDGAVAVAKGTGPRQLLHPLPHSSGWPAGDGLLGSELQTDSGNQFHQGRSLTQTPWMYCCLYASGWNTLRSSLDKRTQEQKGEKIE